MRGPALALACAVLALAAGCGDDEPDSGAADSVPTVPTVEETAPVTTPAPQRPAPQRPAPPQAPRPPGSGGTPAPSRTAPPDSPANDRPPEPGSPAERFERECERNPAACG